MSNLSNSHIMKPFSYPCLQAILPSLNPNLRTHLSASCSELRTAEQSVPLKLDHLRFDEADLSTEINGVSWNVGIFMKYPPGEEIPHMVQDMNERNGLNGDIDNEGRRDWPTIRSLKPGDLTVQNLPRPYMPDEATEDFTPFIVLRVGDITKEIVEYKKNLLDAQRYMNTRLFGNRKGPILVKRLTVAAKTLRLPEGVQFQVKELDLGLVTMEALDNLKPILAPASFPLDLLRISITRKDFKSHTHPLVRSARCIHVLNSESIGFLPFLTSLRNPTIITNCHLSMLREYINLVNDWKTNRREIGASLTFETYDEESIEQIFTAICGQIECGENEIGETFVPLTRDTAIKITADEDKGEIAQALINDGYGTDYNYLKLEVVQAEQDVLN